MDISRRGFVIAMTSLPISPIVHGAASAKFVYVGTYTRSNSKGIYLFRYSGGTLEALGVAAEVENPSFLTIHPNRRWLYAVNEVDNFSGQKGGSVTAYAIDTGSGKLTLLNQKFSGGGEPCFVTVDN